MYATTSFKCRKQVLDVKQQVILQEHKCYIIDTSILSATARYKKTEGGHPLEPIDKVLLTLRFYASGNFLQVIGDIVAVGS